MRITCGKCDDCIHQGVCKIRDENEVVGCAGDFMSVDEVVSALGKQTPKEICKETLDTMLGEIILGVCPSCKTSFGGIGNFNGYKFCPDCGQAIDWGGRDNESTDQPIIS